MNVTEITAGLSWKTLSRAKFRVERLGFETTVEVRDTGKLAFAAAQKSGAEIIYQSCASVERDSPHPRQPWTAATWP